MADNMKKKSPSFPSNYVTLVQLQERWLKEKERKKREEEEEDRRQQQSQLEDEASETRKVEPEYTPPSQLRPIRRDSPEVSAPEVELARDGGGADRGEKTTAKKKKKKRNNSQKKGKNESQRKLGSMAEDEVAVKEPPLLNVEEDGVDGDTGDEIRAESGGLNRTAVLEAESRVSSSNLGIGKRNYGFMKGGKKKSHERRTKGGEARAESDILDEKADLGTKSWALSVNVVIGAEDEMLLRRNGGGDNEEVPARRSREKRRDRGEAMVESNGLDRPVDVESQFRALSVNGETVKKNGGLGSGKGKKRSGKTRAESDSLLRAAEIEPELTAESNGLDRSVGVESQFRALSMNGESVKKNGGLLSGKGKKRSGETRAEIDTLHRAAEIEPELRAESSGLDRSVIVESQIRALSVSGETVKKNDGQRRSGRGKRTRGKTRAESDSLDRAAEIEPELGALPVNGVAGEGNENLRNGKKQDGSLRRNQESRRAGGETRPESSELDQTAGIEPEVRALPVNGWVRKGTDGSRGKGMPVIKNGNSRGGRVETRAERTNLDKTADIEPKFRALSVNGETKEGNGGLGRIGVKEESQGTVVETMVEGNSLNQMNGIEAEIRTLSAYGRTGKGSGSRFGRTSAGYNRSFRESRSFAYGKFSQREGLKGRDSGMVWVKKGEA